jgi:hypothetical protein
LARAAWAAVPERREALLALGEALAAQQALTGLDAERAAGVALVVGAVEQISEGRSADLSGEIRQRLARIGLRGALVAAWAERVGAAEIRCRERQRQFQEALPAGAVVHLFADFEVGPEVLPPGWYRGSGVARPERAAEGSCARSLFVGRGMHWGEMSVDYEHPEGVLTQWGPTLRLRCRVWAENAKSLHLLLGGAVVSAPDPRRSVIEIPLPRAGEWIDIDVALAEKKAKPFHPTHKNLLRPGDDIRVLWFMAHRRDAALPEGALYIDDVVLYSADQPGAAAPRGDEPRGDQPGDAGADGVF